MKISASFATSIDRYFTQPVADEDTLIGTAKITFTDGRSSAFVPYLSYVRYDDFQPFFRKRDDALNDVSFGFFSGVGLRSGQAIPYGDARDPGDVYASIDARGGQRVADPRDLNNSFVDLSATLGYFPNDDLELIASAKLRVRWYDDYRGDFRRDIRPGALLNAVWTPRWLTRILPRSEIDFTAIVFRNFSTLPDKTYSQWEVGPTASLRWKF